MDIKWTPHLEQSFLDLKLKIKQGELKLALPNPHKRFYILTDASNYVIGAALLQESTTSSHKMDMISTNSRLFSVHELTLSMILRECSATVYALLEYEFLILGSKQPVLFFTDHKPVMYFFTQNSKPNHRILKF